MKKVVAVVIATLMVAVLMTGCTESEQVSYNIGKEADNFNVTRKLTVINARTDTILLEWKVHFLSAIIQTTNWKLSVRLEMASIRNILYI